MRLFPHQRKKERKKKESIQYMADGKNSSEREPSMCAENKACCEKNIYTILTTNQLYPTI